MQVQKVVQFYIDHKITGKLKADKISVWLQDTAKLEDATAVRTTLKKLKRMARVKGMKDAEITMEVING